MLKEVKWRVFVRISGEEKCNFTAIDESAVFKNAQDINSSKHFSNSVLEVLQIFDCTSDKICHCKDSYNPTIRNLAEKFSMAIIMLGILGVLGNFILMTNSARKLIKRFYQEAKEKRIYNYLILNLSLSYFLLGICALIYGTNVPDSSKTISLHFVKTTMCNALGFLAFLSNQVSVSLLLLISGFRLYSVVRAYGAVHFKYAVILSGCFWIFWIVIASIPFLFKDFFTVGLRVNHSFDIPYKSVKDFVKNIVSNMNTSSLHRYVLNNVHKYSTNIVLNQFIANSLHFNDVENQTISYVDYYNSQPLCTLNLLVEFDRPGTFFTLAVVVFNFFSYMFMLIAYAIIYKNVYRRKKIESLNLKTNRFANLTDRFLKFFTFKQKRKKNKTSALRIFLIMITDFICWFPMTILATVYFVKSCTMNGCELCKFKNLYATLASFLIPLILFSSAINPFIYYTNVYLRMAVHLKNCFKAKCCFKQK